MTRKLLGARHAHGCRRCHIRYEDACTQPETDALCTSCRGGRAWQLLRENEAPHPCCLSASRLVSAQEKATYRLAGSHLWFICTTCKRTQPQNPRSEGHR